MQLKEAYDILELKQGSTPEEAKTKYRELTKKWHPDINKTPEAESKFKKINEAYECVKNGKGNDKEAPSQYHRGANPFHGNPFGRSQVIELKNIEVHLSISFKESVLGCKKEIKYSRKSKCNKCDGAGEILLNNGCKKCGGSGRVVMRQGQSVMISTCTECGGRQSTQDCLDCSAEGSVMSEASVNVTVPPGVINNNVLRLQGMGNYVGSFNSFMGAQDQYTDTFCHLKVEYEPDLSINGKDVVINIGIPLVDALRGCSRNVKTIDGSKEIHIKPRSKNKEEILIPNLGVGGLGNQRVILDVSYPDNVDQIINLLNNQGN